MANQKRIHPLNVPGNLFVDLTCIDCGTCFHLAPETFKEAADDKSYVFMQPTLLEDWTRAKRAVVSCPTNSIGVKDPSESIKAARTGLPLSISENVYYCGYTSRESFGASSYLIIRKEGNILIDSPRFHPSLVKSIESVGGIKYLILTHQDDVADHKLYANHFHCTRIMHKYDLSPDTADVEMVLDEPGEIELLPELKLIHTPGHTRGHIVIYYKSKFLFSGDHLFFDLDTQKPRSSKSVCWYSWKEQIESTRKLLAYDIQWLLPGHGGWGHLEANEMRQRLIELTETMDSL